MKIWVGLIGFVVFFLLNTAVNATIIGSKHDLSVTNFYGPEIGASKEVCVFCHTPHASSDVINAPLWNRRISDMTVFQLYGEDTPIGSVPNAISLACLSCHDGVSSQTVSAVTADDTHGLINLPNGDDGSPNCNACHPDGGLYPGEIWQIGPNLTNDHPISISYDAALAADPTGFQASPLNGLKLFGADGNNVECATCHNVHNPDNGTFLRVENVNSALCLSCHIK